MVFNGYDIFLLPDIVPPGDTSFKVSMTPWANYTFRVIARNKVGNSAPSEASSTCSTPADVPFKNPDNVEGRGTTPSNLVIYWTISFIRDNFDTKSGYLVVLIRASS